MDHRWTGVREGTAALSKYFDFKNVLK